jgi:hypothetical protein
MIQLQSLQLHLVSYYSQESIVKCFDNFLFSLFHSHVDLSNLENYTFYMYGHAFSKIQLEKGKILEVAIYLLMKKASFEITSMSKR